jgi:hypothetical protein
VDWRVSLKIAIGQRDATANCELRTATAEKAGKMLEWTGLERRDASRERLWSCDDGSDVPTILGVAIFFSLADD